MSIRDLNRLDTRPQAVTSFFSVTEESIPLVLARLARHIWEEGGSENRGKRFPSLVYFCKDEKNLPRIARQLGFFAPDIDIFLFPPWNCDPYDRASPSPEILGQRISTLSALASRDDTADQRPSIFLTTVSAALQRIPPVETFSESGFYLLSGDTVDPDSLIRWCSDVGYERVSVVHVPGNFSVRGGIIDIFPVTADRPLRLDFFGNTLESLRTFDPQTQRTRDRLQEACVPYASEIIFDRESTARFMSRYAEMSGSQKTRDIVHESISSARRVSGIEHWMPLFYENLATLFDSFRNSVLSFDHTIDETLSSFLQYVSQCHAVHVELPKSSEDTGLHNVLPIHTLYLDHEEWERCTSRHTRCYLGEFGKHVPTGCDHIDLEIRKVRLFFERKLPPESGKIDSLIAHVRHITRETGRDVVIASRTDTHRERLHRTLSEYGLHHTMRIKDCSQIASPPSGQPYLAILELDTGFETADSVFISEQDIFGKRHRSGVTHRKSVQRLISEMSHLTPGEFIVHQNHGIGKFEGLRTISVSGKPHDCLELTYAEEGKLYLPVENVDLISRYGSSDSQVSLDKLGASSWQSRRTQLKEHIRATAHELIKVAATRQSRTAQVFLPPDEETWNQFRDRFPFEETEDQESAIRSISDDLASGYPMDRLVCGDVGFGKTEVALRAAFTVAMSGYQVALVAPTTLLSHQHFSTFSERFKGFPVQVQEMSRLLSSKEIHAIREKLAKGLIDIIIGTHSIFSKHTRFRNLGLLIVDEEQHFGVAHKECIKNIRNTVHILTLTATPIPRTLQMAMSGVRDLSVIASPPVDRLAVRTLVLPFDPTTIREAILKERARGGQTLYVCPHISDLEHASRFISEYVPELKFTLIHGQLPPHQLEKLMSAFRSREFDVLLSTAIVESGLDIPTANTLVVYRADLFGLAQLHQLRGRVGRSNVRAHAFLTFLPDGSLTRSAEKRLKVLQELDSLGSGFTLAEHDLDIRGAGNILGEEQAGRIRGVGFELYQQMLEEQITLIRNGDSKKTESWSPQLSLGGAACIPASYMDEAQLRLRMYRRLSLLQNQEELDQLKEEMTDRFGKIPEEFEQLLDTIAVKLICRWLGIEKLDAGDQGMVITFRKNCVIDTESLLLFITKENGRALLKPDHRLAIQRQWQDFRTRIEGIKTLLQEMSTFVMAE